MNHGKPLNMRVIIRRSRGVVQPLGLLRKFLSCKHLVCMNSSLGGRVMGVNRVASMLVILLLFIGPVFSDGTGPIGNEPAGDLNGDDRIDLADLTILAQEWLSSTTITDLDTDGIVGMNDLAILASNWQKIWQSGSLQVTIAPQGAIDCAGPVAGGRRGVAAQRRYCRWAFGRRASGRVQHDHGLRQSGRADGAGAKRPDDGADGFLYYSIPDLLQ